MTTFQKLSETDVLPLALCFCNGTALAAVRSSSKACASAVPSTSPLWDALLHCSAAWLVAWPSEVRSSMSKAVRLGEDMDRCNMRIVTEKQSSRSDLEEVQAHRHRIVVTGARKSGVSTIIRMLVRGPPEVAGPPRGPSQDMNVHHLRAGVGCKNMLISVVDKRITAISTPFSASLYQGHTAALFVFDASRMEETLVEAASCIQELSQAVGPGKFASMPKFLICHKADLLLTPHSESHSPSAPAKAALLPNICQNLLQTYGMDLVFTTFRDQSSVDLAFALAAEQWPQQQPNVLGRQHPMVSAERVAEWTVNGGNFNLFEELQARVHRID